MKGYKQSYIKLCSDESKRGKSANKKFVSGIKSLVIPRDETKYR